MRHCPCPRLAAGGVRARLSWDGARRGHTSSWDAREKRPPPVGLRVLESSACTCTCTVAEWPQAGVSVVVGCHLDPQRPAPSLVVCPRAEGRKAPPFIHLGATSRPDDVVCFSNSEPPGHELSRVARPEDEASRLHFISRCLQEGSQPAARAA